MLVPRPIRIALLSRPNREQVAEWINDPTIYEALDIKTPIGVHHLVQRELPIYDRDGVLSMDGVFPYEILDANGTLIGFCLSYAWDDDHPKIRELDYALPGIATRASTAIYEVTVRIPHAVFSTEQAHELRVYLRPGHTPAGHVRIFKSFGCDQLDYEARKNLRGPLFRLFPDAYYASPPARRFGITR